MITLAEFRRTTRSLLSSKDPTSRLQGLGLSPERAASIVANPGFRAADLRPNGESTRATADHDFVIEK